MNEGRLKCDILKGMFSDERAMVYPPGGRPTASSFFVPEDQVSEKDHTVRVRYFRRGNVLWAVVPAEHQPVIPVNQEDLIPSP